MMQCARLSLPPTAAPTRPRTGALLVLGGAVLWGTTGTAQALGPEASTPLVIGALRLLVGGAGLVALAAVRDALRPLRHAAVLPLLVGTAAVAAYQVTFFAGVDAAGVALGTVVGIGSAPVWTGLLDWATSRIRPTGRWAAATALAVAGVVLLLGAGRADGGEADPRGILLALGAGLSYAVYTVAAKRALDAGGTSDGVMAAIFGGGAVLLAPLLATAELGWVASGAGIATVLWLGLGATTLAYVLFGRGLARVPAPTAATLTLAEPLTAAVLGVALLAERPAPVGWAGAGLVLAGLAVLTVRPPSRPR